MSQTLNNSNTRLFVSGLYDGIGEQNIRQHFEPFGTITDLYILRNKNKKSRGCCFIGFLNKFQASNALKQCDKTYIGTRRINVKFAFDKCEKQKKPFKNEIASSSIESNTNINENKNKIIDKKQDKQTDKQYQQFLRLTKSAANIPNTTDDFINNFLNSSDDSDSDNIINDLEEVKQHNNQIKDEIKKKK
eukprot:286491_1